MQEITTSMFDDLELEQEQKEQMARRLVEKGAPISDEALEELSVVKEFDVRQKVSVGKVTVAGLNASEAEDAGAKNLEEYLNPDNMQEWEMEERLNELKDRCHAEVERESNNGVIQVNRDGERTEDF